MRCSLSSTTTAMPINEYDSTQEQLSITPLVQQYNVGIGAVDATCLIQLYPSRHIAKLATSQILQCEEEANEKSMLGTHGLIHLHSLILWNWSREPSGKSRGVVLLPLQLADLLHAYLQQAVVLYSTSPSLGLG